MANTVGSRYFCPVPANAEIVRLPAEEAHHFANVLRGKIGDPIILIDGSGCEFLATVTAIKRDKIDVQILSKSVVDRELDFKIAIAVALPKGDRQKVLVEKLTELGVQELIPLITERGVAQPTDSAIERLMGQVIAACKQSGRTRFMNIARPQSMAEMCRGNPVEATKFFADITGTRMPHSIALPGSAIIAAVGPEGGFSPAEFSLFKETGWSAISLGNRILRVETAAIALAAILPAIKPNCD